MTSYYLMPEFTVKTAAALRAEHEINKSIRYTALTGHVLSPMTGIGKTSMPMLRCFLQCNAQSNEEEPD
jgi:hypothetical protein